ncbi:hypothetical protein LSTR_LSTR011710 [Laodelphax striatellus]|uniref:Uncharacterized protein n=1 Tax=Laodelphax striatellus TaxID=195883 RepID=A0A482WQF9_LAOST|nr:hypothetical protein LSTR_LSTR011710 [Laodelphax striatellus]
MAPASYKLKIIAGCSVDFRHNIFVACDILVCCVGSNIVVERQYYCVCGLDLMFYSSVDENYAFDFGCNTSACNKTDVQAVTITVYCLQDFGSKMGLGGVEGCESIVTALDRDEAKIADLHFHG